MEGDAAGLSRQVQAQLTAQDQKSASGGVGRGKGAAGDDAADAAQKIRQHRHTGAQLAAHTAVPQHPVSRLPHRQTQQRRQQQPAAQHGAAQQRGVQPRGGQYLQLLQNGGYHQQQRGERTQHQPAAQPVAPALFLPQGVVHARLRLLRFLRLRLVLRLVKKLLRLL